MKAFWWFKDDSIAGMARPGFNSVHWFDLPFDEAVLLGWLGQYSSGVARLESFRNHLRTYAPKIYKFHKLDTESGNRAIKIFDQSSGLLDVFERLNHRTQIFNQFEIVEDQLHLKLNTERLKNEIQHLKSRGIKTLVSLTESQHNQEILRDNFVIHHISIEDLNAPTVQQAQQLAEVIQASMKYKEKLVVHCLAGIGRTSTMLMAAHLLLGESFKDLESRLARQNPSFALTGSQSDFIQSLKSR